MDTPAVSARLIGAIFVEKGLITDEQLEQALQQQESTGERLGEILVTQFGVSRLDLAGALAEQWAEYERPRTDEQHGEAAQAAPPPAPAPSTDEEVGQKRPIGEIFIERGLITEAQLEDALAEQRETGQRLGEILVGKGIVNRLALASALADQWAGLQKLRPPAPADVLPAVPVPQPTDPFGVVEPGSLDELRSSIGALQARLDERTNRDGPPDQDWRRALDEVTADLGSRIVAVEGRLAQAGPELARDVADLRAAVEELGDRRAGDARPAEQALAQVSELTGRLELLETRLSAAVATMDDRHTTVLALEETISASHALAARVDALETGLERQDHLRANGADAWREPLERVAAELGARLEALEGAGTGLPPDVRGELAELQRTVAALQEQGATLDETAARELAARVDALEAARAEHEERLREPPAEPWRDPLEQMAREVEERLASLGRDVEQRSGPLAAGIEGVRTELAALRERVDARGAVDPVALTALHDRLDELEAPSAGAERIEVLRHDVEGRLQELADARSSELSRLEQLERRLGEIDPQRPLAETAELREAMSSVRARIEQVAQETVATLGQRLDRLEAGLGDARDAEARTTIEELRGRIDRAAVEASAGLAGRIEALEERLAATSRLETGLSELGGRVDELAGAVEGGVAGRLEELQARLAGLETRAQDVRDDVARRGVDELRGRIERAVVEISAGLTERVDAVGERLPAFQQRIAELETRVAQARDEQAHRAIAELREHVDDAVNEGRAGLEERVAGVEARVAGAGVEHIEAGMEALARRVDEVDTHADERAGALARELDEARRAHGDAVAGVTGQLAELRDGLDRAVSRDELEARFDRLERTAAELGVLTPRIDELTARADLLSVELERDLRGELDEARSTLGRSLESLSAQVRELGSRLGGLDHAVGAELRPRVEELQVSLDGLSARADAHAHEDLRARIDELERRTDGTVEREQLDVLAGELRESVETARRTAESAASRDEVDAALAGLHSSVEELGCRVGGLDHALAAELRPLADGLRSAFDELAARVDEHGHAELAHLSGRVGQIERLVSDVVRHDQLEAAVGDVRAAVDDVRSAAAGRAELEELRLRIDEADQGDRLTGLDARLAELERRTAAQSEREQALRSSLEEISDGLGGDLDALGARVEGVDSGFRTELAAAVERGAAADERLRLELAEGLAALDQRITPRAELDGVRHRLDALDDVLAEARGLGARAAEDAADARRAADEHAAELAQRLADVEQGVRDEVARAAAADTQRHQALADAVTAIGERLGRLESDAGADALRRAVEQLDDRVRDVAVRAAEAWLEGERELRRDLEALAATVEERDASAIEARAALQDDVDRATASLGWRLEKVEEALHSAEEIERLEAAVAQVERRLELQLAQADAQVKGTEKALRKGLKSLAARIAEGEAAYLEAGAALRGSIERLGGAIGETDARIAERETGALPSDADGFVAFAPTGDGYRLVELVGPAPEVGDSVTVPEVDETLVVTRVARSPLPLDARPCAYLERRA
jgi:chromosome segregation ATPase